MSNERKLKIKDAYLELIIDIGFDYDGLEEAESLKILIDELVNYARLALESNDTESVFATLGEKGKQFNILQEEIKRKEE